MADEKLREHKEKLLDELNTNIIKKVKEEVQEIKAEISEIKDEMECKIREVEQKWEKEHNEMCQWIAESEGERHSTKIILSGDIIPPIRDTESPKDVALEIIQQNLHIPAKEHIISAVRFGPSPTRNGQQPNRKILVELRNIQAKRSIVDAALQVKCQGLFINELLPKKTNELYFEVRKLKKDKKIQVAYTKDGVIRVKKTREGATRKIYTKRDLEKYIKEAQIQL